MGGNARSKDRPDNLKFYGKGVVFVAYQTTKLYT